VNDPSTARPGAPLVLVLRDEEGSEGGILDSIEVLEAGGLRVREQPWAPLPDTELDVAALVAVPLARLGDPVMERVIAARRLEVVGRLVGGIAHDFNNVLSVVTTLSELLLRFGAPDDPDREDVEEIHKAARRGSDLTRQLMAFARTDVGEPGPVDVRLAAEAAEKLLRKLLPEDVALELVPGHDPATVAADPVEVDQIVLNLLAHGRERLRGGGTIRLSIEPAGAEVALCLTLTPRRPLEGDEPGPAPDRRDAPAGTPGLGPVGTIATRRGGSLAVDQADAVEIVRVTLPAATAASAATGEYPSPAGERASVLIVEDDPGVRAGTRRLLESLGYRAAEAAGAAEAWERIRTAPPDAVLCAAVLRDGWGPELERRVRREGLGVPFLFVAGYEEHPALAEIRTSGGHVVRKPVTGDALEAGLARALGTRDDRTRPS
jgi:hypothetical protein